MSQTNMFHESNKATPPENRPLNFLMNNVTEKEIPGLYRDGEYFKIIGQGLPPMKVKTPKYWSLR